MKRKNFFLKGSIALLVILSVTFCSKEKPSKPEQENNGKLYLTISMSDDPFSQSNKLKAVSIWEYNVLIFTDDDSLFIEYDSYNDVPDEILLPPGSYYIIAHSNNDSIAAFDNPYYYGRSQTFNVGSGNNSEIEVMCQIMNCAVSVHYAENIIQNCSDYRTVVRCGEDSLVFSMNEERTGFFAVQNLYIRSELYFPSGNGSQYMKVLNNIIENPEPGSFYRIVVDASAQNLLTSIQLQNIDEMDTTLLEMNDYLQINDLLPGELLITEIMYDPTSINDTEGEWIEIYNNTSSPVNLDNLVITSGTNTFILHERIILESGSYAVFARSDTAFDGNKIIFDGISLTNTSDDISLHTFGSDGTDGVIIATVSYDESNGFPNGQGTSIQLNLLNFNFEDAQTGSSWCLSTEAYNTGDNGSPGLTNTTCN